MADADGRGKHFQINPNNQVSTSPTCYSTTTAGLKFEIYCDCLGANYLLNCFTLSASNDPSAAFLWRGGREHSSVAQAFTSVAQAFTPGIME